MYEGVVDIRLARKIEYSANRLKDYTFAYSCHFIILIFCGPNTHLRRNVRPEAGPYEQKPMV